MPKLSTRLAVAFACLLPVSASFGVAAYADDSCPCFNRQQVNTSICKQADLDSWADSRGKVVNLKATCDFYSLPADVLYPDDGSSFDQEQQPFVTYRLWSRRDYFCNGPMYTDGLTARQWNACADILMEVSGFPLRLELIE